MKRNRSGLIAALIVATLVIAIVPMLTVQADYGTNWTGTFYDSAVFLGNGVQVSGINGLNFNWGTGVPVVNGLAVPGIGADNFSARFTSTQYLAPGKYNFVLSSDDGLRFYINGELMLDKFITRPLTTNTVSVTIPSSPVNITVEYFENIDQAILQVQWFLVKAFPLTPTPTLDIPVRNYFEVAAIPLSWNRVSWAVGYEIEVATDKLFTHIVWRDDTLSADTLATTTPDLHSGTYYWRVQAKVNKTTWGNWSASDVFTVQAQVVIAPWTGTFFPSNDLSGTGVPVSDIQGLNFNWGTGAPIVNGVAVPGIPQDNFSARFTSTQELPIGQYNFVVSSDDGVRLYVNGAIVLDKFIVRALDTDTVTVSITSSPVNLTVEYFEGVDQAILQVQWFPK